MLKTFLQNFKNSIFEMFMQALVSNDLKNYLHENWLRYKNYKVYLKSELVRDQILKFYAWFHMEWLLFIYRKDTPSPLSIADSYICIETKKLRYRTVECCSGEQDTAQNDFIFLNKNYIYIGT